MHHFPTRILLATDGSEDATLALRAALDLSTGSSSELHVVHAWQAFPEYSHPSVAIATDVGQHEREAQKVLFEQLDKIEAAGADADGAHLKRGRPIEVIVDLSEELGADLVIVGSRGLGPVKRLVMGSVSDGVVDLASCPVLVVRGDDGAWPPARIVVGQDGSSSARKAAELAASMGRLFGAEVLLVKAHPMILPVTEAFKLSQASVSKPADVRVYDELALMELARKLEDEVGLMSRFRVVEGEAASVLLAVAEEREQPALISVGRRGLGLLDRLRLGSVSTKVLRASTGPVLVCP